MNEIKYYKYRILIIDFGSQYSQLLLRRVRELGVYSELFFYQVSKSQVHEFCPDGIILSGGPHSVVDKKIPSILDVIFNLNIPVLGICYGMQVMAKYFGGDIYHSIFQREFGEAQVVIRSNSKLIENIYDSIDDLGSYILDVWMSHGDVVQAVPKDFTVVGTTNNSQVAIMANESRCLYGIQFHPEVTHTKTGKDILKRFILDICHCKVSWKSGNIINDIIKNIQKMVNTDKVVLAFSGGIDSLVTALLLHRAIGKQLFCIFVNNGLLYNHTFNRLKFFLKKNNINLNIIFVDEEYRFLDALRGIVDPEEKRKVIGKIFIEVFEEQIGKLLHVKWLAQGTICSDIIESGVLSTCKFKNVIKSHHNVGGLPKGMHVRLLEPIRSLFKDEVRCIGLDLGLPHEIVYHHPCPGPGLAVRIIGEVKKEYCNILREADCIVFEELKRNNLYTKLSQAFAVFLPIHSVGIQGDKRKYKWVIALRAIETVDFMTAQWFRFPYDVLDKISNRIVNEICGVSRVVYDISSKPPATIEWE